MNLDDLLLFTVNEKTTQGILQALKGSHLAITCISSFKDATDSASILAILRNMAANCGKSGFQTQQSLPINPVHRATRARIVWSINPMLRVPTFVCVVCHRQLQACIACRLTDASH